MSPARSGVQQSVRADVDRNRSRSAAEPLVQRTNCRIFCSFTAAVAAVLPRAGHSFWGRPGELMRGARS